MKIFNKNVFISIPGIFFWILVAAGNVFAHDVIHDIKQGNAIIISVGYETGEPMQYAEVLIYSPKDSKVEYQNGRTDAKGSFAFVPDLPGEWKIVVDDADGHGFTAKFNVDKSMNTEVKRTWFQRLKKLASGIILILGLTGILYYIRARKMNASINRLN